MILKNLIFIPAFIISFCVTYFLMPLWIRHAKKINLVGRDMHKIDSDLIPEAGGIVVLAGIFAGIFYYVVIQAGYYQTMNNLAIVMGVTASLLGAAIIGVLDDLAGGWKVGLKQWQKPLLTIAAALPFMLVSFERSIIDIPLIGEQNIGMLLPLLFVPMAIVGASNGFNMLAGYNGLEAGMGIVILGAIALLSYLNGHYLAVLISLIGLFALVAFLIYNWYPSKIFPGDTMTYSIGAYIAMAAILGRVEKYGLLLFAPYFLDFLLPLRKKMKVEAFAKVNKDGSIEPPYDQIYDTTHLVIHLLKKFKKKVYEKDVVLTILGFECVIAVLCLLLFC